MITVQVVTKNNRGTIERCLESAFSVGGRVVVADLGSDDGTEKVCVARGAEVRRVSFGGDMSALRNSLLSEGRNLYLEPWEFFSRGDRLVGGLGGNASFYVVQGGFVSKQVRLWGSGRFRNPIFEYVECDAHSVCPGVVVSSSGEPDRRREATAACRSWAERSPTSSEPYYYLACSLLAEGKADEFMGTANHYLSMDPGGGDSYLLMNYYMARVEASKGMTSDASRRVLGCLAARPTFAEFWCLLGDLFFMRGKYEKALHMYENARIIGRKRSSSDSLPVEISKYGSYPRAMEARCREAGLEGMLLGGLGT